MAKLIGHYFNAERGGFSTFEVDNLKETEKQYAKTKETTDGKPQFSYEYWNIMPKNQLGELRQQHSGNNFTMYALQEDMPRFRALVIDRLTRAAEWAKRRYIAELADLAAATGEPAPTAAGIVNKDFFSLTREDFDTTLAGLSGLEIIVAPLIMQTESGTIEQAAQFGLDMQIAADAVREIKQQIYGVEDGGAEDTQ